MPQVHTTEQWFLKRSSAVYGPVTRQALMDWAATGRIRPDDLVSTDNITWHSPSEVSFLEMNWIVEPPGGQAVGPVNIAALIDPLLKGTLSPESTVRHRETGQSEPLFVAVIRYLLSRQKISEPASGADMQQELAEARQQVQLLREQVRELQQAAPATTSPPHATEKEQPGKATAPAAQEPDEHFRRLDALIRTELAELRDSLHQRDETIVALERRIAELREEARREREEASRLRERLHELAAAHEDLLRSFRDLHARLVSRPDMPQATAPAPELTQPLEESPAAPGPQKKPRRRLRLI